MRCCRRPQVLEHADFPHPETHSCSYFGQQEASKEVEEVVVPHQKKWPHRDFDSSCCCRLLKCLRTSTQTHQFFPSLGFKSNCEQLARQGQGLFHLFSMSYPSNASKQQLCCGTLGFAAHHGPGLCSAGGSGGSELKFWLHRDLKPALKPLWLLREWC